jgi:hypothetical protein
MYIMSQIAQAYDPSESNEDQTKLTWWEWILKNKVAILLVVALIVVVLVYWFYYRKAGDGSVTSDATDAAAKFTVTRMRGSVLY